MKFDLIDYVDSLDDGRIEAVKAVTSAEEYLGDHFPGFPILPGVMMLETLVQAGRRLLRETGRSGRWVLQEARNVRYGGMVRPGETLRVQVEIKKDQDTSVTFLGSGTVGEQTAVQGKFTLRRV